MKSVSITPGKNNVGAYINDVNLNKYLTTNNFESRQNVEYNCHCHSNLIQQPRNQSFSVASIGVECLQQKHSGDNLAVGQD